MPSRVSGESLNLTEICEAVIYVLSTLYDKKFLNITCLYPVLIYITGLCTVIQKVLTYNINNQI
jgi:hypothetical protein